MNWWECANDALGSFNCCAPLETDTDRRVDDLPLMDSPVPMMVLCLSYVALVKVIGPNLMKNRKPFNLSALIMAYNVGQIVANSGLFILNGKGGWFGEYSLRCQPLDRSDSQSARYMIMATYLYMINKLVDFMDTVFFVLRKKDGHVSILHVVHHGLMPMSTWIGVRFSPGGHATFFGLLNTFIHVVMYVYYSLAALGPVWQKRLWWKKYLTGMQMLQFMLVIVHSTQLLFTDCNYPKVYAWFCLFHAFLFLFLFANFYRRSYARNVDARCVQNGTAKLSGKSQ